MNKKPGLLFAVAVFAIVILAASFHMNYGEHAAVHLRDGVNPDNVLYVCEITQDAWTNLSESLHFMRRYAAVFFSFIGIILVFSWGWAFYQNLLKDKFSEDVYKNPWGITKVIFWMIVIVSILFVTPNHFRRVEIRGHGDNWVLCESTSDGARAVNYRAVTIK